MTLSNLARRTPAFFTALALFLPITSHAGLGAPNPLPAPLSESRALKADEQEVQTLLENYYAAFDAGDSLAMRLLVLDAKPFSQVESGSLDQSWGSYQESHLQLEIDAFDKTLHTAGLVQLHTVGNDAAYAIYRLTLKASMGEKSGKLDLLATAMLVKSANRWYLQHIHTSTPPKKAQNKHAGHNMHSPAGNETAGKPHAMQHKMRNLSDEPNKPGLTLAVTADPMSGWNLTLTAENFAFAPEKSGGSYEAGTGHAHLYVDGIKVGRIYSNWFHLNALPSGEHRIRVTLNGNDHSMLMVDGEEISSEVVINQP